MNEQMHLNISEFYKFHKLMERSSSVNEVLDILINTVNRLIPQTDMAIAYLYDSKQKVLRLGAGFGVSTSSLGKIAFRPGESLTGKVFLNKKALACANRKDVSKMMSNISSENLKWYQKGTYKRTVRSSINVPMMDDGHCIGTFTLNRYNTEKSFSQDDIKLLYTLTGQAAGRVGYIRISETLEDSRMKEQFSQILIGNGSRKEIIGLLEKELKSKFFLDAPGEKPANAVPIIQNSKLLGYLTATGPLSDFSQSQRRVFHHAADALATLLGRQLDNYEDALHRRSECFKRTLDGEDSEALMKYLHVKKDEPVHCFAISAASHEDPTFARHLQSLMDKYFPRATLFFIGAHYVILSPSREHLENFAKYLSDQYGMVTGTGKARPITQIKPSYEESVIAAAQNTPHLVEYSSLGYNRLWHHLDDHVKHEFINDHIGPLLELSNEHLSTIGALIENGRTHKSKTAEQLFIHTNTLYQRLRKIESILDINLQDEQQWMNIVIAYELYVALNIQNG